VIDDTNSLDHNSSKSDSRVSSYRNVDKDASENSEDNLYSKLYKGNKKGSDKDLCMKTYKSFSENLEEPFEEEIVKQDQMLSENESKLNDSDDSNGSESANY
jgi:hypothetical protein